MAFILLLGCMFEEKALEFSCCWEKLLSQEYSDHLFAKESGIKKGSVTVLFSIAKICLLTLLLESMRISLYIQLIDEFM